MTVTADIESTLKDIGYPVAMDRYEGKEEVYILYNVETVSTSFFMDNKPRMDTSYIQIHLYCPKKFNYFKLKKSIKVAMFHSGFSYPQEAINTVEDDTNMRHIAMTTNKDYESEV